jgi:hypothetical protein
MRCCRVVAPFVVCSELLRALAAGESGKFWMAVLQMGVYVADSLSTAVNWTGYLGVWRPWALWQ